MMKITGNNSNIVSAVVVSLLLHLVAFGVAAEMQSMVQNTVIREYIPVELVQLVSLPRNDSAAPAAARQASMPQPPEVPAPVVRKNVPEPIPAAVLNPVVSPLQSHAEAATAVSSQQPRSAVNPDGGAAAGVTPATSSGSSHPQKRDKGSYQAFHRLTRLPTFRTRAEPQYPSTERISGNEARVLAEIYLDEHGVVDEVTIKKSGGPLFDKAVITAAHKSSFHPGYMGEKAVPTVIQIPYVFKLK